MIEAIHLEDMMKNLIRVKAGGATLFLTQTEYKEGLKRGKAILRARKQRQRESDARAAVERRRLERLGVFPTF